MKSILKSLLFLLLFVYITFSSGFVAYKSYYWFMFPNLTNLPLLSYMQITCVTLGLKNLSLSLPSTAYFNDKFKEKYIVDDFEKVGYSLFLPWSTLGFMYIIYLFI